MAVLHWFSLFLILSTTIFVNAGRSRRSPIVTDDLAQPNQFRWAVAITNRSDYICSGGIIGERHILSAAHCFMNSRNKLEYDRYMVYAGTINFQSLRYPVPVIRSVGKIFVPKDFGKSHYKADIAVLELRIRLQMNNLRILTLPSPHRMVANGERAEVAAFGANDVSIQDNNKPFQSDGRLRYANIRIVDNPKCHKKPGRCIFGEKSDIGIYNLLGQMEKNDTTKKFGLCFGDSGGCLVDISGQVIGVYVVGSNDTCDDRTEHTVYTKVSYYVPFILQAMSGNRTKDMRVRECQT